MAIRFSLCCSLPILPTTVRGRPTNGRRLVMMCANNQISINLHIIRSSVHHKNKVFEDRSAGIVCYKDENGEITCEGYDDEGPRFHQPFSPCNNHLRIRGDGEIIELLQRCLVHVSEEDEVVNDDVADVGVAGYNCNKGSK